MIRSCGDFIEKSTLEPPVAGKQDHTESFERMQGVISWIRTRFHDEMVP